MQNRVGDKEGDKERQSGKQRGRQSERQSARQNGGERETRRGNKCETERERCLEMQNRGGVGRGNRAPVTSLDRYTV